MTLDGIEAWANGIVGYFVAIAAVAVLRAAGAWEALPAWVIPGIFLCLSVARSRALRALFRRLDHAS